MVQGPAAVGTADRPTTLQLEGVWEAKLTVRPESEVAERATASALNTAPEGWRKVIVCCPLPHSTKVLPLTVTVLLPIKAGLDVAPMGAKLTVAVIAGETGTVCLSAVR